jgi:mono/diheme cytochrome c family protein
MRATEDSRVRALPTASVWAFQIRLLKWVGVVLGILVAVVVGAMAVIVVVGWHKLNSRSAPVPYLTVAGSAEQIERGHAIANAFCGACHSKTGTLTGGEEFGKHFPIPLGTFVSANLTPAGPLKRWSDGEIFRAIRNSVDRDGRQLFVMSLTNAGRLSDDDITAVIAYIRSLPVDGVVVADPPDQFNPLGLFLLGTGKLPGGKPVITAAISAPPKAPTVQYGEYIMSYQDCRECHGADLTGGVQGQLPPIGPGLSLVKDWKLQEFITTMRSGIDPNGHQLSEQMPWRPIGKMDDEELTAVYTYLTNMPDRGSR